MEDLVCRTFSVTLDRFGKKEEIDLIPNGQEMFVTKRNVKKFVRLFIEYTFIKSCESQIKAFKRGFLRVVDLPVLRKLVDCDELE